MKQRLPRAADTLGQAMFWGLSLTFLRYAILFILAGCAVFLIGVLIFVPDQSVRAGGPIFMSLVALTAWVLLFGDRVRAAVFVLTFGIWAAVTALSFLFGGVRSVTLILYPLIIILAGWLVGERCAIAVAALSAAATLGFAVLDPWGFLPAWPLAPSALYWVVQSSAFAFSALLIVFLARSYKQRLEETAKLGSDLALRTAELQAREADLNRAQAVAHVGSWVCDLTADVVHLSAETCRIFGLPEGSIGSHKSHLLRVHPQDRAAVDSAWRAKIAGAGPLDIEHRILVGDTVRWVRVQAQLEFDAGGRPLRAVGTTQDISGRKQAELAHALTEAQLRESQKVEALGTLAGGVAHDFNNIVAAIMGNVELALQDVGPGHAAQESLEEIGKASRRAKDLVQQILAFGRRQVLQRQVMALQPVVEESARLLRATLPAGVRLSVECAPGTPPVLADATQVQQVLLNLCANAWQAMQGQPRPAAIEVSLASHLANAAPYAGPERRSSGGRVALRPGSYACLTVRDTGPGMDRATRSRIFEPFFTTKPVGQGTGLGLAVVHGILQDHGASIAVHSAPGEGATFRMYFPEAPAPALPPPGAAAQARAARWKDGEALVPQGTGKTILYVDDDEAIVFLMTRLIEREGYRVSGYTDARAALAAVRAQPDAFDLVVTDYNMPGMSGLEVARALREIRADLPVALASGYVTEELRAEAPAAGVSELIYKPNTADELCAAVARLVNSLPR